MSEVCPLTMEDAIALVLSHDERATYYTNRQSEAARKRLRVTTKRLLKALTGQSPTGAQIKAATF